jgi:hypothetical protein
VEIYRDAEDSRRWMEINRFGSRERYLDVMEAMNRDPRIEELFERFNTLLTETECEPEKSQYFRMV